MLEELDRKIEYQGETFVVELSEDRRSATVTSEKGETAKITIIPDTPGHAACYRVHYQQSNPVTARSTDPPSAAVDLAMSEIVRQRKPVRSFEEARQELVDYVEDKDGESE